MLRLITLRFGDSPGARELSFEPGALTVIVGPNNSGKSLLLNEVGTKLLNPQHTPPSIVLGRIEYNEMTSEEVLDTLSRWDNHVVAAESEDQRQYSISSPSISGADTNIQFRLRELESIQSIRGIVPRIVAAYTLKLDGERRLSLLSRSESRPLSQRPSSILMALFQDDERRQQLRAFGVRAFNRHLVIDLTDVRHFRARMSHRPPMSVGEERGVEKVSVEFHRSALPLEGFSDGVRAYLGILAAAICSEYRVLLIDEPEAFLHPPLQRDLGIELARLIQSREGTLIAATHSAEFLMGCVQSGVAVNVLRLTYDAEIPTATLLPGDELLRIARDPLMRSAKFLNALFHRGAVICEGDTDRVLYEEIAYRLDPNGLRPSDVLFLNGIGKQTVPKMVDTLRQLGIAAAAVVDLDIIKESDLSQLLRAARVPQPIIDSLNLLKVSTRTAFNELKLDLKVVGTAGLPANERAAADQLLAIAADYGVFIAGVGEAERWLANLGVRRGRKDEHLAELLSKLGSDPTDEEYVLPTDDDVWEFVRKILSWIANPNRKGMQSQNEADVIPV